MACSHIDEPRLRERPCESLSARRAADDGLEEPTLVYSRSVHTLVCRRHVIEQGCRKARVAPKVAQPIQKAAIVLLAAIIGLLVAEAVRLGELGVRLQRVDSELVPRVEKSSAPRDFRVRNGEEVPRAVQLRSRWSRRRGLLRPRANLSNHGEK